MTDSNMTILVVDDYNTMVRIIKKLLKTIGYENVDDASNGEEALGKIKQKQYGLVISDWNMEPMTGFDLLKAVRADETTAKTPFILVTAESKPENVLAAQKAGVSSYLVKPFSAPALKEKIDAVLTRGLSPSIAPPAAIINARSFGCSARTLSLLTGGCSRCFV